MTEKQKQGPYIPQAIAIVMLLWALNPENPYGYYILLRVVLCATCAFLVHRALDIGSDRWAWVLGVTAVIYNPIIRIHLTREIWSVVNIATIVALSVALGGLRKPREEGGRSDEH
jgi:hypothetical protein